MFSIVCPYYKNTERDMIRCQGIIVQQGIHCTQNLFFDSRTDKLDWLHKYCTSFDYKMCPTAKYLERLYEKNDKSTNDEKN